MELQVKMLRGPKAHISDPLHSTLKAKEYPSQVRYSEDQHWYVHPCMSLCVCVWLQWIANVLTGENKNYNCHTTCIAMLYKEDCKLYFLKYVLHIQRETPSPGKIMIIFCVGEAYGRRRHTKPLIVEWKIIKCLCFIVGVSMDAKWGY